MCGIAGAFSTRNSREIVADMTDFLEHRGPDDAGTATLCSPRGAPRGTFGHRRLAIIDLSQAGHQPMFTPDRNLCLTYNGEIYNFLELRGELQREGVRFVSSCDTEVILEGWRLHGEEFLGRLRGMFALAIWDSAKDQGFLIRDSFGIKPLYYSERAGEILFASEVKALLATNRIPRVLSGEAVRSYLSTGSVAEPYTIIAGILAVPPGCVLPVTREHDRFVVGEPIRFASAFPDAPGEKRDLRSHVHRIRSALRESVRYHLVSDVPVAVFLSGGIDSSAIAGLASEVSDVPIESFTVTFEEADFSEAVAARDAARRFKTHHHEILLSGRDLLDALPGVFAAMDQPSLDGLNTYVVSRAVRSFGLKVVLSGLGGDELFAGYPSFNRARYLSSLWKLPNGLRRIGAAALDQFNDTRADRISGLLRDRIASRAAYRASRTLFGGRQVGRLVSGETDSDVDGASDGERRDISGLSLMQQVSFYETTGYMRNTLLRDSDVFSMTHALELRVPLVDRKVADVAQEAAADMKLKHGTAKPLLVEAVRDLLTPESIARPKKGFTLPFETWMRTELFSEVDSILSHDAAEEVSLSQAEVRSIWLAFQNRRGGMNWSRPWALYTLIRWARQNQVSLSAPQIAERPVARAASRTLDAPYAYGSP